MGFGNNSYRYDKSFSEFSYRDTKDILRDVYQSCLNIITIDNKIFVSFTITFLKRRFPSASVACKLHTNCFVCANCMKSHTFYGTWRHTRMQHLHSGTPPNKNIHMYFEIVSIEWGKDVNLKVVNLWYLDENLWLVRCIQIDHLYLPKSIYSCLL